MQVLLLAEDGVPFSSKRMALEDWPWAWLKALSYAKVARNVMERANMDDKPEEALPPKWMWWKPDAIRDWFDSRKGNKNGRR